MRAGRQCQAIRLRPGHNASDNATLRALEAAMVTSDPAQLGVGADGARWPRRGEPDYVPPKERALKLQAAWRVQNPELYGKYSAEVDRCFATVARGGPDLMSVNVRPALLSAVNGLPGDLHSVAINENFLFQGLPVATIDKVIHAGMNERFSGANAGTLFGEGLYFAEDPGKCDRYATDADGGYKARTLTENEDVDALHDMLYPDGVDDHPGAGVRYMLLCRVVLGHALRTKWDRTHGDQGRGTALDADATRDGTVFATRLHRELMPLRDTQPEIYHNSLLVETCDRGPVGHGRPTCRGLEHDPPCRSGRIHRYREFVVFHGEQLYPEYIVAYRRGHNLNDSV